MSYFLENESERSSKEEVKAQDGIASIEPLLDKPYCPYDPGDGFEKAVS